MYYPRHYEICDICHKKKFRSEIILQNNAKEYKLSVYDYLDFKGFCLCGRDKK
jgi:hypothetical protein